MANNGLLDVLCKRLCKRLWVGHDLLEVLPAGNVLLFGVLCQGLLNFLVSDVMRQHLLTIFDPILQPIFKSVLFVRQ